MSQVVQLKGLDCIFDCVPEKGDMYGELDYNQDGLLLVPFCKACGGRGGLQQRETQEELVRDFIIWLLD